MSTATSAGIYLPKEAGHLQFFPLNKIMNNFKISLQTAVDRLAVLNQQLTQCHEKIEDKV